MEPFSSRPRYHPKSATDNTSPPASANPTTPSGIAQSRHLPPPPSNSSKSLLPRTANLTPVPPIPQHIPLPTRQESPTRTSSNSDPKIPSSRPIRSSMTGNPPRTGTPQKSPPTAVSTKPEPHHNKPISNPTKSLNRPVGLAALTAQSQKSARYASHGTTIRRANAEALATQFATFQRQLHEFSIKHGAEIRQNAQFRGEFAKMCAALGVDPLAAAVEGAKAKAKAGAGGRKIQEREVEKEREKGITGLKGLFWERIGRKDESRTQDKSVKDNENNDNSNASLYDPNYDHDHDHSQVAEDGEDQGLSAETKHHLAEMLGGSINQFYWELGLRIIQIVIETRTENGGLIELAELKRRVRRPINRGIGLGKDATAGNPSETENENPSGFGSGLDVSEQDIIQAIHSLAPLGPGYTIITIRRTRFLRSVPRELNPDQTTVLAAMQVLGYATVSMLRANLDWSTARAYAVLQDLVVDSVAWVDREEGVFWEAGSTKDIDGYVGGVWEDRYWAASWMYKRRDDANHGERSGDGGVYEDPDGQEFAVAQDIATAPTEAESQTESKGEGESDGKINTIDTNLASETDRPRPRPEPDKSTTSPSTTATGNETNINKTPELNQTLNRKEKEKEKEKDNDESGNTISTETQKIYNHNNVNDYFIIEDDEDVGDDSKEDDEDEDEDPAAFEESQNRIKAKLRALLESRIAENTSTSGSGIASGSKS